RGSERPPVSFQQMTFRRGVINGARFAPDGESYVFSAKWEGGLSLIFSGRPGTVEHTALPITNAVLASVSSSGELLLLLEPHFIRGFTIGGTLARVPLAGGTPRPLLESIHWADWSPDGKSFAIVRDAAGKVQL